MEAESERIENKAVDMNQFSNISQKGWRSGNIRLKVSLCDVGQNLKPNSQNIELQTFNNKEFYWQLAFMRERDEKRPFIYYYVI